ncbi:MAG: class I SAM-dependent methyltransferase [Bacteroidota bacterium]
MRELEEHGHDHHDGMARNGSVDTNSSEGRFAWQKPTLVIEKLGDLNGKTIADIGAGTGYFTFRMSSEADKVIAIDIDPDMIELINIFSNNLDSLQRSRIETRLAVADNPRLAIHEVDKAIIINTIGYIQDKKAYLRTLKRGIKPDGTIMIVDFKMKRIPADIAPAPANRVSILDIENMLVEDGYTDIKTDDRSLDYQYIITARNSL